MICCLVQCVRFFAHCPKKWNLKGAPSQKQLARIQADALRATQTEREHQQRDELQGKVMDLLNENKALKDEIQMLRPHHLFHWNHNVTTELCSMQASHQLDV